MRWAKEKLVPAFVCMFIFLGFHADFYYHNWHKLIDSAENNYLNQRENVFHLPRPYRIYFEFVVFARKKKNVFKCTCCLWFHLNAKARFSLLQVVVAFKTHFYWQFQERSFVSRATEKWKQIVCINTHTRARKKKLNRFIISNVIVFYAR